MTLYIGGIGFALTFGASLIYSFVNDTLKRTLLNTVLSRTTEIGLLLIGCAGLMGMYEYGGEFGYITTVMIAVQVACCSILPMTLRVLIFGFILNIPKATHGERPDAT
jgi:hypothetical protein